MNTREHFYIDGAWQAPAGGERIDVRSASTEEVIGHVPRGTAAGRRSRGRRGAPGV